MKLTDCNFFRSGRDVNFSVFSDDVCRVYHRRSISLPLGGDVDVYQVDPGPKSHWIVVRQTEDGKHELRWFLRKGSNFEEGNGSVPQALKAQVGERFPLIDSRVPASGSWLARRAVRKGHERTVQSS
jgi:hypothetical protein